MTEENSARIHLAWFQTIRARRQSPIHRAMNKKNTYTLDGLRARVTHMCGPKMRF